MRMIMSPSSHSPSSLFAELPALGSLEWLQGSPQALLSSSRPKLCLLFQTNCPGCHSYAIPAANELLSSMKNVSDDENNGAAVDVYAVSTAFEDFEFNTQETTKLLLTEGRRVGVVKERYGEHTDESSTHMLPSKDLAVAYDRVVSKQDASPSLVAQALHATKSNAREQLQAQIMGGRQQQRGASLPPEVERALNALGADALPEKLGEMFYAVAAQGTPTWILHDNEGHVLDRMFGSYSTSDLKAWVRQTLD